MIGSADGRPLLGVRGLAKRYGAQVGCRDVGFDLWPGEVLGIVGESGSGKTTVLNCLSGRVTADGGQVIYVSGGRSRDDDKNGGGAGAILAIAGFALLILAPLIAQLMQFAVSRRRESLADISGVELTRYPPGLIAALEKLRDDQTVVHSHSRATAHLWIEQPMPTSPEEGKLSRLNRLFDTHPPLEERIAALREL